MFFGEQGRQRGVHLCQPNPTLLCFCTSGQSHSTHFMALIPCLIMVGIVTFPQAAHQGFVIERNQVCVFIFVFE